LAETNPKQDNKARTAKTINATKQIIHTPNKILIHKKKLFTPCKTINHKNKKLTNHNKTHKNSANQNLISYKP
jgi:hypothetical protein